MPAKAKEQKAVTAFDAAQAAKVAEDISVNLLLVNEQAAEEKVRFAAMVSGRENDLSTYAKGLEAVEAARLADKYGLLSEVDLKVSEKMLLAGQKLATNALNAVIAERDANPFLQYLAEKAQLEAQQKAEKAARHAQAVAVARANLDEAVKAAKTSESIATWRLHCANLLGEAKKTAAKAFKLPEGTKASRPQTHKRLEQLISTYLSSDAGLVRSCKVGGDQVVSQVFDNLVTELATWVDPKPVYQQARPAAGNVGSFTSNRKGKGKGKGKNSNAFNPKGSKRQQGELDKPNVDAGESLDDFEVEMLRSELSSDEGENALGAALADAGFAS